MSYVSKYYADFYWRHRSANNLYRAILSKDGYSSSDTYNYGETPTVAEQELAYIGSAAGQQVVFTEATTITQVVTLLNENGTPVDNEGRIEVTRWSDKTVLYSGTAQAFVDGTNTFNISYTADPGTYAIMLRVTSATTVNLANHFGNVLIFPATISPNYGAVIDTPSSVPAVNWLVSTTDSISGTMSFSTFAGLTLDANDFEIRQRGSLSNKDDVIFGSEAVISFWADKGTSPYLEMEDLDLIELEAGSDYIELETAPTFNGTTFDYDDILESAYKDYKLQVYRDPAGTNTLIWEGYVKPENTNRSIWEDKVLYTVSATDAIADLKQYEYSNSGTPYTSVTESFLTIIKRCLNNIGIELPFKVQLGTYSDQMSASDCALFETSCNQKKFYEVNGEKNDFNNCYEVIEKILNTFNCVLRQSDGEYWIVNRQEPDSYYFSYTWALGDETRTLSDLRVLMDDESILKGRGTLQKIEPATEVIFHLKNYEWFINPIQNPDFEDGTTGWNTPITPNAFVPFTTGTGFNYAKLKLGINDTPGTDKQLYTNDFTPTIPSDATDVTLTFWAGAFNKVGTSYPTFTVDLIKDRTGTPATINGDLSSITSFALTPGFVQYTETFDLSAYGGTAPTLSVDINTDNLGAAGLTTIDIYFDQFVWELESDDNLSRDIDYHFSQTGGLSVMEYDVDFIDSTINNASDVCSLFDDSVLTTTWARYGKSENVILIYIIGIQKIGNYQGYKNFYKMTFLDSGEQIYAHKFIKVDGCIFQIIGMNKNYRDGTVTCDMVEVLMGEITPTTRTFRLNTINGE